MELSKEEDHQLRALYWRLMILPWLLPACGILLWSVLILAFGYWAFALGVFAQAISFRRLPALLGVPMALFFFGVSWHLHWGPFVTVDWTGSHEASVIVALVCFLAFFSAGARFFRGWRYQRFKQEPGWFMIRERIRAKAWQDLAREEADANWKKEAREALYENVGFHPRWSLDLEAIYARGGHTYGDYYLFKCPKCGRPVLFDYEVDDVFFDLDDFKAGAPHNLSYGPVPCVDCGFGLMPYSSDDLEAERDWLLTPQEIHERGLDWIVRKDGGWGRTPTAENAGGS